MLVVPLTVCQEHFLVHTWSEVAWVEAAVRVDYSAGRAAKVAKGRQAAEEEVVVPLRTDRTVEQAERVVAACV